MKQVVLLMTLLLIGSCGFEVIKLNPVAWVSDHKNERILNHKLGVVNCSEKRFDTFYHFSDEDFKAILYVLRNAKIPAHLQYNKTLVEHLLKTDILHSEKMR